MTLFWITAIGMTIAAVVLVVWPLLTKNRILNLYQNDTNFQLAKERLHELKFARSENQISIEQFDSLREDLEDNLVQDLRGQKTVNTISHPNIPLAVALASLLPLIVFLLYFRLGSPNSMGFSISDNNSIPITSLLSLIHI